MDQNETILVLYYCFLCDLRLRFVKMGCKPSDYFANNEEEANDKLQKTLYDIYPVNKGYFGHSSKVLEVPSDLYLQAYQGYVQ